MIDLDQLVQEAREIEPLPASISRLAGLMAEEDSNLQEICRQVAVRLKEVTALYE